MNEREILKTEWRTGGLGTVGIVLAKTGTGKLCAYISPLPVTSGYDEERGSLLIADWGARLSFEEAKGFFPEVTEEDYYFE